ncbi:hypothetical protein ACFSDI_14145 [Evansella tamaricis]
MTNINFTINLEELKAHVEKSPLESHIKAALALVLNARMEQERDEYINAPSSNRTGRPVCRSGTSRRFF